MAGTPSRYVEPLVEEDREVLSYLRDHGETPRIRRRALAVLLSDSGKSVNELADIFEVRRNTISSWLDCWESEGLQGLADAPRSGAPPKLTKSEIKKVVKLIKEHPHSPRQVLGEISKTIGKTISRSTLRRIARRFGLRWKRTRRSLKSKRDEEEFEKAKEELEELKKQHRLGDIDLYYFDEAGFSLVPPVRYGWQPIGETLEIPSTRSKQLNVLGFLSLGSQLTSYTIEGTIDTDVVIACFDNFCESLERPSFVAIDNASPHSSKKFESRIPEWEQKGLFLYFLPPYCPELNLIEILWRMIKYEWLPLQAYDRFKSLIKHVSDVLSQVGTRYTIDFAAMNV
jgi:transposase